MKLLEETGISLYGPDNTNLKTLGKINLTLTQVVLATEVKLSPNKLSD